jgi:hypothetical protein
MACACMKLKMQNVSWKYVGENLGQWPARRPVWVAKRELKLRGWGSPSPSRILGLFGLWPRVAIPKYWRWLVLLAIVWIAAHESEPCQNFGRHFNFCARAMANRGRPIPSPIYWLPMIWRGRSRHEPNRPFVLSPRFSRNERGGVAPTGHLPPLRPEPLWRGWRARLRARAAKRETLVLSVPRCWDDRGRSVRLLYAGEKDAILGGVIWFTHANQLALCCMRISNSLFHDLAHDARESNLQNVTYAVVDGFRDKKKSSEGWKLRGGDQSLPHAWFVRGSHEWVDDLICPFFGRFGHVSMRLWRDRGDSGEPRHATRGGMFMKIRSKRNMLKIERAVRVWLTYNFMPDIRWEVTITCCFVIVSFLAMDSHNYIPYLTPAILDIYILINHQVIS